MNKFRKDDLVKFMPEYEDGEQEFDYVLIEDPESGRLRLLFSGLKLQIKF